MDELKNNNEDIKIILKKAYKFLANKNYKIYIKDIINYLTDKGYELLKEKKDKIIMFEPFDNISVHIYFEYDKENKKVLAGIKIE